MKTKSNSKGFTLLELLIILAIIGTLTAIAAPGVMSTISRYQMRGAARELIIDFKKAKNEAAKRNRNVFLEFTLAAGGNPGSYVIFADNNNDGVLDPGENYKTVNMPAGVLLSLTTFAGPPFRGGYSSRGLPGNGTGSIVLSNTDGTRVYTISMSVAGGVQLQ